MKKMKLISGILSAALLGTMCNFAVMAEETAANGVRVLYSENFDSRTTGEISTDVLEKDMSIQRVGYWGWTNTAIQSTYNVMEGVKNSNKTEDKSLRITTSFNHDPISNGSAGSGKGVYADKDNWATGVNTGVNHMIMLNPSRSDVNLPAERYLHISFSAAQDVMPDGEVGMMGAGLDMIFELWCNSNNTPSERKREYFHWYGPQQQYLSTQYLGGTKGDAPDMKYAVPMATNESWVSYDYIFDLASETMDIYTNGYPVVKGRTQIGGIPRIVDIKQINFQVRNLNQKTSNVYLDDIKVEYCTNTPVVSPQSVFGTVEITAPEGYVDNEKGIIYDYEQTPAEVKSYITSAGAEAYLVAEKADSTTTNIQFERKDDLTSLKPITLNDGRTVNPILYVKLGGFTYCYEIKQPQRTIYSEDFDGYTEWNDTAANSAQFARKPFHAAVKDNIESTYTLAERKSGDNALNIHEKFTHPYGTTADGTALSGWSDDRECWVNANSGVHHRLMSNTEAMQDHERYMHISFSAAQDPMPIASMGDKGTTLDVTFELMADKKPGDNDIEFEFLHWAYGQKFELYGSKYQTLTEAGEWATYDYVFDTTDNTVDVYVNGYRVVKDKSLSSKFVKISGVKRLNFQVRDMDTGAAAREFNVSLDDVKVEYRKDEPVISTYSTFGEAAQLNAAEKYVDSKTGVIYNYGQTLTDVQGYLSEGKTAYLVAEKNDSTLTDVMFERIASESLNAIKLTNGKTVSPILYVKDGNCTYYYEIVQTISYDAETKTATIISEKDYDEAVTVLLAGYQNGRLVTADLQEITLRKGDNAVTAGEGFEPTGVDEVKVMVWDSAKDMTPLYSALTQK